MLTTEERFKLVEEEMLETGVYFTLQNEDGTCGCDAHKGRAFTEDDKFAVANFDSYYFDGFEGSEMSDYDRSLRYDDCNFEWRNEGQELHALLLQHIKGDCHAQVEENWGKVEFDCNDEATAALLAASFRKHGLDPLHDEGDTEVGIEL